jgi:hypothetical protein
MMQSKSKAGGIIEQERRKEKSKREYEKIHIF